jgi:hypothetical protein
MLYDHLGTFFDLHSGQGRPFLGDLSATFPPRENAIQTLIIILESHFKVLDMQQDVFFTIAIISYAL